MFDIDFNLFIFEIYYSEFIVIVLFYWDCLGSIYIYVDYINSLHILVETKLSGIFILDVNIICMTGLWTHVVYVLTIG